MKENNKDELLVEVRGISKSFGQTLALNDVNLKIKKGRTHALIGRNGAGKSTLVSIITGLVKPDSGELFFSGKEAPKFGDLASYKKHVACVYQYSTIMPNLSVAENLLINKQNLDSRFISWSKLYKQAQNILDEWDIPVDVRMEAGELDVENRQLVEIARSLSFGARFIILDEPTAMLDPKAIQRLFKKMQDLQKQGVTFMFISHHLSEVYEICQDISVYRDAKHIITASVEDLPEDKMIEAMTGEKHIVSEFKPRKLESENLLEISKLNCQNDQYKDISISLKKGEMIGIIGNSTSGKVELAHSIVGLEKAKSGTIKLENKTYPNNIADAIKAGIGFVPEDRHKEGFIPQMGINENSTMTIWSYLSKFGFLNKNEISKITNNFIKELDIKTFGEEQEVSSLSGGNQQKVVQARAMANKPKLLVMINPTAGVDIKSKASLLDYVLHKSHEDKTSVIIVSDEIEDMLRCDRVLVMSAGEIKAELTMPYDDKEIIAIVEGFTPKLKKQKVENEKLTD